MKNLGSLITGIIIGVILTGIVGWKMMPGMMLHENVSPYGTEETVNKIKELALKKGWVVPGVKALHRARFPPQGWVGDGNDFSSTHAFGTFTFLETETETFKRSGFSTKGRFLSSEWPSFRRGLYCNGSLSGLFQM